MLIVVQTNDVSLIPFCHDTVFICLLFRKAMEKVMNNKAMIEAMGEPIEKGPWYNASLAVSQQRHSVSCSFPVIGPQGTGILHLKAVRNGGQNAPFSHYLHARFLRLPFFSLVGSCFLLVSCNRR